MSKVAVVGAGYVGLTTAMCLAHLEHEVCCVDINDERIAGLRAGVVPIREDGMEDLLRAGLDSSRLTFSTNAGDAVADAEFVFLCVGTPSDDNGEADLSAVDAVATAIAPHLMPGVVIVNKSTMPVGSTRRVHRVLSEAGAAHEEFGVASNPEFLREGAAIRDFLHPSRVVVGAEDAATAQRVADLYRPLGAPVVITSPASAELIKYAANAFLATKISYANAIAALSEAVGADVVDVMLGMGYDPRIGPEFLKPGPGFGGSCFPKDISALLHTAREAGYHFDLLDGVVAVNEEQRERVVTKIRDAAGGSLAGVRVGVWGLTFKANTDDVRDSPAIAVVRDLLAEGAEVVAHDPALDHPPVEGITLAPSPLEAAKATAVVAVLTEWDEYRWIDPPELAAMVSERRIVDARNLLDPVVWRRAGFVITGIGRL